jgi:hypothetical protein
MFLLIGAAVAAITAQGPFGGVGGQLPPGSYARSCQNSTVLQGRLYSECADRSKRLRASSIDLRRCNGAQVENVDGLLTCRGQRGDFEDERRGGQGRPGGGPGPGYGGGRPPPRGPSITVYEDSEFRGRQQTFTGEVPNLAPTPFNDRITSFRVQGVWQVCTNANYGGQCFVYDSDESNVSTNRINDQISSLRPMRR